MWSSWLRRVLQGSRRSLVTCESTVPEKTHLGGYEIASGHSSSSAHGQGQRVAVFGPKLRLAGATRPSETPSLWRPWAPRTRSGTRRLSPRGDRRLAHRKFHVIDLACVTRALALVGQHGSRQTEAEMRRGLTGPAHGCGWSRRPSAVMRAAGSPVNSRGRDDDHHHQDVPWKRAKVAVRQDEQALSNAKAHGSIGPKSVATPAQATDSTMDQSLEVEAAARSRSLTGWAGVANGEGARAAVTWRGCRRGKRFEGCCARGEGGSR